MHSCIYEGVVRHHRFEPAEHEFGYGLFMVYLDLAEVDQVFDRFLLWSAKRPNLAWFHRSDFIGESEQSLADSVRAFVRDQTGKQLTGPIRLLTQLRYFGFAMNPVCFFYCFDATGSNLECVVAEVTNTPWGEKHRYLVEQPVSKETGIPIRRTSNKSFHVSPFMEMNMTYHWHLSQPGRHLSVRIENFCDEPSATRLDATRLFDSHLSLRRREISHRSMAGVLLKFPAMTLKIIVGIYWQALRLWWKNVPFVPHPQKVVSSTTVSRNVHSGDSSSRIECPAIASSEPNQ